LQASASSLDLRRGEKVQQTISLQIGTQKVREFIKQGFFLCKKKPNIALSLLSFYLSVVVKMAARK